MTAGRGARIDRRTAGLALLALAAATLLAAAERGHAEAAPVVAAASDLRFALTDAADAFTAETGATVTLTFGASGNIARQIRQGAPYDLFLSADESYVRDLARDGLTRGDGVLYALGRLVLAVPEGSPLAADGSLADLRKALAEGRVRRFAIANPEHAPYGQRAAEALRHAGLWEAVRPHLVHGENVSQAAQYVASGNADGGLVAHSLALAPAMAERTDFAPVPADWHSPLRQRMVLLPGAGETAERFYDYLQAPAARAILARYGFAPPSGEGDR